MGGYFHSHTDTLKSLHIALFTHSQVCSILQRSIGSPGPPTPGNGHRLTAPHAHYQIPNRTRRHDRRPARDRAPPLTTARTAAEIEQIQLNAPDAHGALRCISPRSPTTHSRTTKVDSHVHRASKAAIQPLIARQLAV